MNYRKHIVAAALLTAASIGAAQEPVSEVSEVDEVEKLKLAAVEALITAPPERALPAVTRVLQGNNSDEP